MCVATAGFCRLKMRVEKRTGLAPETQHISFKEEPLNDNYATMEECKILHNDTVIVKTEKIVQTVKVSGCFLLLHRHSVAPRFFIASRQSTPQRKSAISVRHCR